MKMKTKIRKGGAFAALTVVLLVTAALITSCADSGARNEYTPPPGKGYVNVSISDAVGRSITTALTFIEFDLTFTEYDSTYTTPGPTLPVKTFDTTDIDNPIDLNPGYYKLQVIAYVSDGGTGTTAMAVGESAGFQITVNNGTDVTVPVGPLLTGSGTGTFGYTVNIAGVTNPLPNFPPDTLTLSITQINIGSASWTNIVDQDIFGNLSSTRPNLPTGYYYVDIVLTVSGQVASVRQVLHIYDSVTSSFTYTFVDGQFIITTGRASVSIEQDLKPTLENTDEDPVAENDTVIVDIYASGTTNPHSETITVINADDYAAIEWFVNSDIPLTTSQGVNATGEELTITAGTAPFNLVKTYQVTVVGTTHGGIPYSTGFKVQVVDTTP